MNERKMFPASLNNMLNGERNSGLSIFLRTCFGWRAQSFCNHETLHCHDGVFFFILDLVFTISFYENRIGGDERGERRPEKKNKGEGG